jgi:hypothetical protein
MDRRLNDAVIPGFPSSVPPEQIPAGTPRSPSDAMQMLEGLRPTSGNLAPEESWRRMLGGRKRYNHGRQQTAKARRDAILIWLMENRMYVPTKRLGYLGTDYIVARHGDGALLAKALGVGKATVCRDLSALQATQPGLFGKRNLEIDYEEYMTFWRYAHRTGLGNEQPGHNLRFPRAQRGPEARTRRSVVKALGHDVYQPSGKPDSIPLTTETAGPREPPGAILTAGDFLAILDKNCPPQVPHTRCLRSRRRLRTTGTV